MRCSFSREISSFSSGYMICIYDILGHVAGKNGVAITQMKAVGYYLPTGTDMVYDLTGKWKDDPKYGLQFEVANYKEVIKHSREGITKYLASSIKGIGPKLADRIYEVFGEETLDILDTCPEELRRIPGISEGKFEKIIESYQETRAARDIVALLAPHKISANRAVKIFQKYGADAMKIVQENPYQLCEISGIGFETADSVAQSLGFDKLSPERVKAGLLHTLVETEQRGNVCLEKHSLIQNCLSLLHTQGLTADFVARQANALLKEKKLVHMEQYIYRPPMAVAEQEVARKVRELHEMGEIRYKRDIGSEIKRQERKLGITLDSTQKKAVSTCLRSHISIITGGPGTGKTLVQRMLLDTYKAEFPDNSIVCCAPTGRAARRMAECTGYQATTIHKALSLMEDDDSLSELDADLVIVDEASMIDMKLAWHLFGALPLGCQIILVGDADQLPSVGPGAVLSELIVCGHIPVVRLEHVFRQAVGSRIAVNAAHIKSNNTLLEYGQDFILCESPQTEESANILVSTYVSEAGRVGIDNVALITPFRKNGLTGVTQLNLRLQEKLNPKNRDKPEISHGERVFRLGDKVMQIKNANYINNGDVGYITAIEEVDGTKVVEVDYGDERMGHYESSELSLLELAYASTVHKSQGCEYKSVIISLQMANWIMLNRPLIYTAITRAKESVIIIGESKALRIAINKVDVERRITFLAHRVQTLLRAPAAGE